MEREQFQTENQFNLIRFHDANDFRWYAKDEAHYLAGEKFVSVTTVLDCIQHVKLKAWIKKNTPEFQDAKLKVAQEDGTLLHTLVELDLKNKLLPLDIPERLIPAMDNWKKLRDKHRIESKYSEISVFDPELGYAGSCDHIGSFYNPDKNETIFAVMDLKTGRYNIKTGWQCEAYRIAAQKCLGIEIQGLVGLSLPRTGQPAKAFQYQHLNSCHLAFLSAYYAWKMQYWNQLAKDKWNYLHVIPFQVNPQYFQDRQLAPWEK